jgi:hypothetical protein
LTAGLANAQNEWLASTRSKALFHAVPTASAWHNYIVGYRGSA